MLFLNLLYKPGSFITKHVNNILQLCYRADVFSLEGNSSSEPPDLTSMKVNLNILHLLIPVMKI
jgi:hypothetical protein